MTVEKKTWSAPVVDELPIDLSSVAGTSGMNSQAGGTSFKSGGQS